MAKQNKKEITVKQAAPSEPVVKRVNKKKATKEISGDVATSVTPVPPVEPVEIVVNESILNVDSNSAKPEKKKKKLRHFRVLTDEIDPETGKIIARGRYSGTKPKQAANKAYTAINKEETKKNNNVVPLDVKTEFRIIESTRAIKEPKVEQLDENGQIIPSTRNSKGLQGKKKNKNKNKKTKSIYSYTGCRIILPKEQEVPLRDLSKSLGFVDVVRNVKNKKTGEITQVTVSKEQFPPLYEEVEKMENGVLVKKMEQKTVIYRYKNDVKKKKVEKNAIHVDNILEIEDEVKVGKKPRGTKGKKANKGGKKGNKEVNAVAQPASAEPVATPTPSPVAPTTTDASSDKKNSKSSRKSKKVESVAESNSVTTESKPVKSSKKASPKADASEVKQTKEKSKKTGKSKSENVAASS